MRFEPSNDEHRDYCKHEIMYQIFVVHVLVTFYLISLL